LVLLLVSVRSITCTCILFMNDWLCNNQQSTEQYCSLNECLSWAVETSDEWLHWEQHVLKCQKAVARKEFYSEFRLAVQLSIFSDCLVLFILFVLMCLWVFAVHNIEHITLWLFNTCARVDLKMFLFNSFVRFKLLVQFNCSLKQKENKKIMLQ
jgi:uncharacterized integral membrane protein